MPVLRMSQHAICQSDGTVITLPPLLGGPPTRPAHLKHTGAPPRGQVPLLRMSQHPEAQGGAPFPTLLSTFPTFWTFAWMCTGNLLAQVDTEAGLRVAPL
mmetsp:Transcript_17513/g.48001  ORF Transcript_17513/g.48001 Transcript_17513/m.48001 type:complete len:100 (+) Transcript_17513:370-669(+)